MIEGHGDDSYKYSRPITANFSSNVYNRVDLSALKAHLCARIDGIGNYPEPEPYTLEACLARHHRLPAEAVCVTNGATEAIYLTAQTFRGTNTAIVQPTFSEYADACRMHGHRVTSLYRLPAESEGYRLPEEVRMLWLCNPNNPTGTVVEKEYLATLISHNPQVCFVIDQSYEFFTLRPLFSAAEAAEFPNVLLLHSMTKRYAVPGLRLGYVTGAPHLLHRLRSALEALGGLEVWATETHFMLVCLRMGRASALKDYLAGEHGILIRDASNFDGLNEHFFRIAAQSREENDRLVKAIGQWLEEE